MKPYFTGKVEEAKTKHETFAPGDRVRVLPASPRFPVHTGTIDRLTHSNRGKGRVWAYVRTDPDNRIMAFPIGACRHLKENL